MAVMETVASPEHVCALCGTAVEHRYAAIKAHLNEDHEGISVDDYKIELG